MRTILVATALVLAACSDDRPPAPTAEEAEQLKEAEDMLDALNEEGPAPGSADPSNSSN